MTDLPLSQQQQLQFAIESAIASHQPGDTSGMAESVLRHIEQCGFLIVPVGGTRKLTHLEKMQLERQIIEKGKNKRVK